MKTRVAHGDIDGARKIAGYIGSHVNAWEHGMTITVEAYVPPRTNKQNGLWRALVQKYSEQNGDYPEDLHKAFCADFGPRRVVDLPDRQVSVVKSSSEWSKEECSMMIERIRHEAAELNFSLD